MNSMEQRTTEDDLLCTAVITTWRRPMLLAATLESVLRQSYANLEIVVVCDGDDADVRALAGTFVSQRPLRWVFHDENQGLAAARNTGAREGAGAVVLFLDDDIVADADLVSAHMRHHRLASECRRIVICGRIDEDPEQDLSTYVDRCLNESSNQTFDESTAALLATGQDAIGDDIERGLWCGLNCSVRRNLLLENGGFNEYFRAAEEEMELGQRLHVLGFEFIFEPKARMLHKNTKVWSSYYRNGWRARGALDPYRVFELNQRTPQTQRLAAPCRGFLWERMTARLAWEFPTPFEHLSGMLERIANRTRIHSLFGAWARVARASSYWSEVRKSEHTIEELRQSAGREKTALMMHSICDPQTPAESSYYISPRRFHRFMERFRSAGYKTANLNQWHNDKVPAGHVLLTFDDGYDDLYTELFPFLAENRFTAVIFLVAGQIGGSNVWDQKTGLRARNLLTLSQIREMQKHGVEFGSHTLTHPYLPEVSDAELRHEVTESKKRLEDLLGVEVTSFAYPFGGVDRRVRSAVVTAGYLSAFTIVPGPNWWNDPYSQRRAEVNDYSSSLDFAWKLRTGLGFTASLGMRLSSLENELPTSFLRKAAARVHALGHGIVQKLRPEGQRM